MKDAINKTELVTEYVTTITTSVKTRPVIEINVGTDEIKANEIARLMNSIIASNEELKSEQ